MAVDHAAGDPHSGSGRSVGDPPPLWMPRIRRVCFGWGGVAEPATPQRPPLLWLWLGLRAQEGRLREAADLVGQVPEAAHVETKSGAWQVAKWPAARGVWIGWGPQRLPGRRLTQ